MNARALGALAMVAVSSCAASKVEPEQATTKPVAVGVEQAPSESSLPQVMPEDAPLTKERFGSEAVKKCLSFRSPLVRTPGCEFAADAGREGSRIEYCDSYALASRPEMGLFMVLVYRGESSFAKSIGIPSMREAMDAGREVAALYRDFEGPKLADAGVGRPVRLEARGLMLAGAIKWGSLPSPRATYEATVSVHVVLSDYPISREERRGLVDFDVARALACVDRVFWPRST